MRMSKGIAYFATYQEARNKAEEVGGRVVHYDLGWAVQLRVSGPYWPEVA